jgi:CRISPR-associated endonuclease/helicase Cas3
MVADDSRSVERHAATMWAKSTTAAGEWQPLWTHLIDVGVIARALAQRWLTRPARQALASGLGLSEEQAVAWAAVLAALHDLGKATPHFQLLSRPDAQRLEQLGIGLPRMALRFRHDLLTTILLADVLASQTAVPRDVGGRLARLFGGHHGVFCDPALHAEARSARVLGGACWRDARGLLVRTTFEALRVPADSAPSCITDDAAVRLLGLTVVADWLASAREVCPYRGRSSEPPAEPDAEARARMLAEELPERLAKIGFTPMAPRAKARQFAELFAGATPRPGQMIVERLASRLCKPGLLLVEDATGAGKSEAAFVVVEQALSSLGARGAFVALPTRAASDQAFRRLQAFLGGAGNQSGELHLVHGSAAMSFDYEVLRSAAPAVEPLQVHDDEDAGASGLRASAWFAQRRRGLLATFAVGTIDQALMAALPVRHHALRLAALADRVVVLDEIHAYDTYMSTLLERLLEWLGALGTTVVLLSATLPAARRSKLLAAYGRGAGLDARSVPAVRYPRVIAISPACTTAQTIDAPRSTRCLIELIQEAGASGPLGPQVCAAIHSAVERGGCVAVVMNTVARAQKAYLELAETIDAPRRRLLHARFRFRERQLLEREAIDSFGPPGAGRRPRGAVLVATQVIEQSLDIDFDLLISDLAPIDLLLQRRGRLHRHQRDRPLGLGQPKMVILAEEGDGVLRIDQASALVYAPHVLLRTWLALRRHGATLTTPDDVEALIEAVYGHDEAPCDPQVATVWECTRAKLEEALESDALRARAVRIPPPGAAEPFDARPLSAAEDEEAGADLRAATRLGESVSAVILTLEERKLAQRPLSSDVVRGLLERSVSFGAPRLVHALRALAVPSRWQRNSLLCEHRLIELDEDNRWHAPTDANRGLVLRLDRELGVIEEAR